MPSAQERLATVETRIEHFGVMIEDIQTKVGDLHDKAMKQEGAKTASGEWKRGIHSVFMWLGPVIGGLVGALFERKIHGG
jgi:hypothetical protein